MLSEVVREAGMRFGDRPAFTHPQGWSLTYAQLDRFADETVAGLVKRGIGEGDVVVLVLPSGCEYAVAYVALARIGAITVGVNPVLSAGERRDAIALVGPKLVLTDDDHSAGVPDDLLELVAHAASPERTLRSLRMKDAPRPPDLADDPNRAVAIVLTSGTTGTPKGAVFCNRHLSAVTTYDLGEAALTRWDGGGPMLAGTQFAHVGFMTKFSWYVRTGATLMLLDRWKASDVLDVVASSRMKVIGGVAPQIALMLRDPDFATRDFSAVHALVVGGAPSSPALVTEARDRFEAAYSIRYSSTESGGVGTGTAFDAPDSEALHTVGRPRPGMELAIRNEEGRDCAVGEVGEVCLSSAAAMDRYWDNPAATTSTLRDGWLHTGDVGFVDETGCLTLAGRAKEMYLRGGYNVYPMQVEAVLAAHAAVRDIAVVPRADDVLGARGVAFVVPRNAAEPPTLADLRSFAASELAAYKLPEDLRIVDSLPATPGQKLDRRALEALLAAAEPDEKTIC